MIPDEEVDRRVGAVLVVRWIAEEEKLTSSVGLPDERLGEGAVAAEGYDGIAGGVQRE